MKPNDQASDTKNEGSFLLGETPPSTTSGRWITWRRSKRLVTLVATIAMLLDLIMVTCMEALIPVLLVGDGDHLGELQRNTSRLAPVLMSANHPDWNFTTIGAGEGCPERGDNVSSHVYQKYAGKIGVVLSVKLGLESVLMVFTGVAVDRFGHRYPMLLGCAANIVAMIGYAISFSSFRLLILFRCVQALGTSLSVVSSLALIASVFTEDQERAKATATAFAGLTAGMALGYPFGALTYAYMGRYAPFLIIAALNLLDGILRLLIDVRPVKCVTKLTNGAGSHPGYCPALKRQLTEMLSVLSDPLIASTLGCVFAHLSGLGGTVTVFTAFLLDNFSARLWQLALLQAVASLVLILLCRLVAAKVAANQRWACLLFGCIFCAVGYLLFGHVGQRCQLFGSDSVWITLLPLTIVHIGWGIFFAVSNPILVGLVDSRHNSQYGVINGFYTITSQLGILTGSLVSSQVWNTIGIMWMFGIWTVSISVFTLISFALHGLYFFEKLNTY